MILQEVNFSKDHDIPSALRELADAIEAGEEPHDSCAVVLAGPGQPVIVYSLGAERDTESLIATLTKGQHCVMNSVMPWGSE